MLACGWGESSFMGYAMTAIGFAMLGLGVMVGPIGLLTVPACMAVRRVVQDRFTAPLGRGTLERRIVLGAALAGACTAVAYADAIGLAASGTAGLGFGQALLVMFAPAPLGAIPWAAGELVGGESERQRLALLSSIAVAYALSFAGLLLLGSPAFAEPTPAAIAMQVAITTFAAVGAAAAYLTLRGTAIEPAPPEAVAFIRALAQLERLNS